MVLWEAGQKKLEKKEMARQGDLLYSCSRLWESEQASVAVEFEAEGSPIII